MMFGKGGKPSAPASDNLYFADLPVGFDDASLLSILGAYGGITSHKLLSKPGMKTAALVRYSSVDEAKWIVENLNGNIPQGLTEPVVVRFADTPESKSAAKGAFGYGKAAGKGAPSFRAEPYGKGGYAAAAAPAWGGKSAGKGMQALAGGAPKGQGKGGSIRALHEALKTVLPGGDLPNSDENAVYVAGLPKDAQDKDLYKIFGSFGAISNKGARIMTHPDGNSKGFGFVNFLDAMAASAACQTLNGFALEDGSQLQVRPKGPNPEAAAGVPAM